MLRNTEKLSKFRKTRNLECSEKLRAPQNREKAEIIELKNRKGEKNQSRENTEKS